MSPSRQYGWRRHPGKTLRAADVAHGRPSAPAILGIVLGSAPKVETMTPCRRKRGKTGDGELAQLRAGRRRLRTAGRCRDDPETWSVRRTGGLRLDLARRSCGVSGLLQIAISL